MIELRRWTELGGENLGWLKTRHHVAFAGHGNPAHAAIGALIVWNVDEIAPGTGFPLHPHTDLEIITYVTRALLRTKTAWEITERRRLATFRS